MNLISKILSTAFGIGYSPIASGTAGSLVTLLVYWFLPVSHNLYFLFLIIIIFFVGVITASVTEKELIKKVGSEKGQDPSIVVIDEVIGMLIAIYAIPKTLPFLIAAFILFRVFDILKPFPINASQKIPRGWGIMIDDVIAGIYANILIQLFILIW
jgi:phosphatidylglycerophosphatase A